MGFATAGAVTGAIGWSGYPFAIALSIGFPALWAFAPSRAVAGLVAMAYFLGASRGLPVGASNFFGTQFALGLALWLAASLAFTAVHAALWTTRAGWRRPVRYAAAAILMGIPPFGIVGWAHPITAAGILFPGWGWCGLVATAALLVTMTTRLWPLATGIAAFAFALSALAWTSPIEPDGWRGIDTSFKLDGADQFADYLRQVSTIRKVKAIADEGARVVFLPEGAMGLWSESNEQLWTRAVSHRNIVVLGGASIIDSSGYDNAIVRVSGDRAEVFYRQRMPVPIAMWQPWTTGGAYARFFDNPIVQIDGLKVAPLICYEQLIVWPIIQSILNTPDVLVAIGNGWWIGNTNIIAIQRSTVEAWAALFGLSMVAAFNEPTFNERD